MDLFLWAFGFSFLCPETYYVNNLYGRELALALALGVLFLIELSLYLLTWLSLLTASNVRRDQWGSFLDTMTGTLAWCTT